MNPRPDGQNDKDKRKMLPYLRDNCRFNGDVKAFLRHFKWFLI